MNIYLHCYAVYILHNICDVMYLEDEWALATKILQLFQINIDFVQQKASNGFAKVQDLLIFQEFAQKICLFVIDLENILQKDTWHNRMKNSNLSANTISATQAIHKFAGTSYIYAGMPFVHWLHPCSCLM